MKRSALVMAFVALFAVLGAQAAFANDVTVTMSGSATADALMQVRVYAEGSIGDFAQPNISSGDDATAVRDSMVGAIGTYSGVVAELLTRVTVNGQPGFQVASSKGKVIAIILNGPPTPLEPGIPIEINGITFNACADVCASEVPPVPTVGQWGLVVMVMLLLIGATTIFARRRVTAS